MEQKSMTALVSAFSRAYHSMNNVVKIFDDTAAEKLFSNEEYRCISEAMSSGIGFFNPGFAGDSAAALRWIVDNQLSPAALGRAAFAEKSLERAALIGAKQYLIFGAGYDTFAYRQPAWGRGLEIFELDHPATAADKRARLKSGGLSAPGNVHFIGIDFTLPAWPEQLLRCPAFDRSRISCGSILGVAYYLPRTAFKSMIAAISGVIPKGSSLILDYPDENSFTEQAGERAKKQAMLAAAAGEQMLSGYSYSDMEKLLSLCDLLIYEHLTPREMTAEYMCAYNAANPPHRIEAFDNTNYCLAVKQ